VETEKGKHQKHEHVGQTFGRLTVLAQFRDPKSGNLRCTCRCVCGEIVKPRIYELLNGETKSCGCLMRETNQLKMAKLGRSCKTHGSSFTPEYRAWIKMKTRCYNHNYEQFKDYGGRGIRVCDHWINSFENFLADMGRKPSKQLTLDRKNNEGNYEPGNCRWATRLQQCHNRRCSRARAA
jgi:hypothetical protein